MIASFRSELVKLLRPATLLGYAGAAAGFTVMLTIVSILNADNPSGHGPANSQGVGFAQLAEPGGYLAGFRTASSFLGIVALALFASSVAAEFSTGTIRALLVIDSRRRQLLAGKLAGLTAVLVVVVAFAAVVGAIVAFAILWVPRRRHRRMGDNRRRYRRSGDHRQLGAGHHRVRVCSARSSPSCRDRRRSPSPAAGVAYFLIGEQLILHSLWPSTARLAPRRRPRCPFRRWHRDPHVRNSAGLCGRLCRRGLHREHRRFRTTRHH